jgi:hypothetical protein
MPGPDPGPRARRDDDDHHPLRGILPLGLTEMARTETARTGGTTMGPTPREWLGAGLLALVLVGLIVLIVTTAMSSG